jgi:ABC-2 type transport system ATP-binding protein
VQRAVALVAPFSGKEPTIDHNVVELTVENGPRVGAEVLRALDAAGVPIAGLALREPSLDDVFLNLTGHKSEVETEGESAAHTKKARGARHRGADTDADGRDAA